MHDRNGKPIKLGQIVKIEFIVTGLHGDSEFCNVHLESVHPMPGNGMYLHESAVNTKQVEIVDEYAEPQPFDENGNLIRPLKD